MIDKFCIFLVNKMKKEIPDIDDERAEVITYGLQLVIGEIPKFFITLVIAYILGIFKHTILTLLIIMPYRACTGGFHLKTHIGCIVSTTLFLCGTALLAKHITIAQNARYILALGIWLFGIIMIKLYAPADTENLPILRKSERKQKQIISYIILTVGMVLAIVVKNQIISNIFLFGYLIQSIMITKLAYKITGSKYGYEAYQEEASQIS